MTAADVAVLLGVAATAALGVVAALSLARTAWSTPDRRTRAGLGFLAALLFLAHAAVARSALTGGLAAAADPPLLDRIVRHRIVPLELLFTEISAVGGTLGMAVLATVTAVAAWAARHRRAALVMAGAEALLRRRGGAAVLTGRFVAVLRAFVPGLAGMSRMPFRRVFLPWNLLGAAIWAPGCVLDGPAHAAGAPDTVVVVGGDDLPTHPIDPPLREAAAHLAGRAARRAACHHPLASPGPRNVPASQPRDTAPGVPGPPRRTAAGLP